MNKTILKLEDVSKDFISGSVKTSILKHISLDISEGDFTVIMGPSGAGKSTLLYVSSGMEKTSKGSIQYKNQELTNLNEKEMADIRANDFGFVFQQANLVSNLTLEENVLVAGYMKKQNKQKAVKERTRMLLEMMNVQEARTRLPSDVSGGEAQRAAVARAVINEPAILFADEPTGALNKQNTLEVLDLLGNLNKDGQSIIMVTHDIHAALRGDRILYIEDGQIKGEKQLPKYWTTKDSDRETKLQEWLNSMEW